MAKDISRQERMFALIADWQGSGQSQMEFCKSRDIRYHVFHYWHRRFSSSHASSKQGFIAVQVAEQFGAFAEIFFTSGQSVKFYQPVSADFLKALVG